MKRILKRIFNNLFRTLNIVVNRRENINFTNNLKSNEENKGIFVFPSPGNPWGYMFQRPQQIAVSLSKHGETVLYSTEENWKYKPDSRVNGTLKISDNLYLYNDFSKGSSLDVIDKIYLWTYWSSQIEYAKNNKNVVRIYDWIDNISVHKYDDENIRRHNRLLKESDLVIVTARKLYEEALKVRNDVLLIPNACDYYHFSNPVKKSIPKIQKIRCKSEVIVGYYGAIANWFDFKLLKLCAKKYPKWIFLIVGELYPNVIKKNDLKMYPNIVIQKRQSYEKLPYLLSVFDIAIIPFKVNDITQSTSPVKLYEYMAGGKPVVTTDLNEIRQYEEVLVSKSYDEFINNLDKALVLSKDYNFKAKLQKEAYNNSWDNRVEIVLSELKRRGLM